MAIHIGYMGSFTFGKTRRYSQLGKPTSFTFGRDFFCPLMKKTAFFMELLATTFQNPGESPERDGGGGEEQQDHTSSFLSFIVHPIFHSMSYVRPFIMIVPPGL